MAARSGLLLGAALGMAGIIAIPAVAHDYEPPIISIPTDGAHHASRAGLLSLMETLRGIREQLRSLENQAEVENHKISRLRAQQQSFFADFDRQLRRLRQVSPGSSSTGGSSPSPSVPVTPPDAASTEVGPATGSPALGTQGGPGVTVIAPAAGAGSTSAGASREASSASAPGGTGGAKAAYGHAFDLLRAGRYRHAVAAFQDFLHKYPQDKRAAKAQYWVAETDYVEREYPAAEQSFKVLVKSYPASKKVPNALLKMGYIAKWQGHPGKARTTWKELVAEYPKSMAAQVARNSLTNLGPGGTVKP